MSSSAEETDAEADRVTYEDWAEALADGRIIGLRCRDCGDTTAAPKAACPACGSRDHDAVELPDSGVVHSETTIGVPPAGFDEGYQVAIVSLGDANLMAHVREGATIGGEVAFAETLEVDDGVAPVFEPID